jgi:DNA (cytosine-5)-methyltransferase 1
MPQIGVELTYLSKPYLEPSDSVGKVAELFAGVGGFRVGLARAGWKTVFSNQWEPSTKVQHASEVYSERFGLEGHSNIDIAELKSIPQPFDLLVGGFPCQDYSVAKSRTSATGLVGKKGVLWWEILRLTNLHKPKFIFLENVDRLLNSPSAQRGRDFAVMLTTLGKEGYEIQWRVVNSADYGFPQRRIRIYIVATRKDLAPALVTPKDLILKSGTLARALPVEDENIGMVEFELDPDPEIVSNSFNTGKKSSPFMNSGLFRAGVVTTMRTKAHYSGTFHTLGDVLEEPDAIPNEYWVSPSKLDSWKYLKGAKSEERTHKLSGFKYMYTEGAMSFPDSKEKPSRTILTGEGGSTPSRFKHIVEVDGKYRRLTPLELERLAGFPDNWTNLYGKVTDGRRAFFIGNALVVGIVERIGYELAKDQIQSSN